MKMAKASEADLRMALDITQMLESFERGFFPLTDDMDRTECFDSDSGEDCRRAMEMILDAMKKGSLYRVTFGMIVLLNPKNEAIDHSLDYLEHHPKVRVHDELVEALRVAFGHVDRDTHGNDHAMVASVLAKVDDPENVDQRLAAAQAFARDC